MKKTVMILIFNIFLLSNIYGQVKVIFSMENPRIQGGYFMYDLIATVPSGQVWKAGACNIRVNFSCNPIGSLTVKADNPVLNANPNISGANGYQNITTTSILNGTAISFNILTFNTSGFYKFTSGTYLLGTLRWTVNNSITNTQMNFRVPPSTYPTIVSDSTIVLQFQSEYTVIDPIVTNLLISSEAPKDYELYQNYPNPFNASTKIKYDIPKRCRVTLQIFDISGKLIADLLNNELNAGRYEITWNASTLSSGLYFYVLKSDDYKSVKKMVFIK